MGVTYGWAGIRPEFQQGLIYCYNNYGFTRHLDRTERLYLRQFHVMNSKLHAINPFHSKRCRPNLLAQYQADNFTQIGNT